MAQVPQQRILAKHAQGANHASLMTQSRPIRVAYVCADPGVPCFGQKGCSIHVQEMLRAFKSQDVQIELFAARLDGVRPRGLETIPVHLLPYAGKGNGAAREQAAMAANSALRAMLECEGSFDLIYERYSLWSFAGMEYAHAKGLPGVLEVNAPLIEEQIVYRGLVDRASAEKVAVRAFAAATALVAVSNEVATYLERYPAAQGRVHVIPNGVDAARFRPGLTPALPEEPGTFTIGFVGSLKPWHGLETLIEAFTYLHQHDPGMRLLIVGDGPCRADLEQRLTERGLLGSVYFTGSVAPEEIPAWLASIDVAVAPYPKLDHFYFSPLKVYEYMAAGLPVVAAQIGQLARLIEDDVNGLFYPAGESRAMAEVIARLRDEPVLRHRLGYAGRKTILHEYTWQHVASRVLELVGLRGANSQSSNDEVTANERSLTVHLPDLSGMLAAARRFGRILRRFWPLIRPHRLPLMTAILAMLAEVGLRLLEPWPLKFIFDYLIPATAQSSIPTPAGLSPTNLLTLAALAVVVVAGLRAVENYVTTVNLAFVGNRVLTEVRSDLYQHLLKLSLSYHTRARSGDLVTRLTGDVGRLQEVAVTALLPLLVHLLTLLGMLGLMLWMHWRLALVALFAFPLVSLSMARLGRRIREVARKQRKREGTMAAVAAESLNAIKVIHTYSLENVLSGLFVRQNNKSEKESVRGARLSARMERTVDALLAASTALVLWYGVRLVLLGSLTPGDLLVFMTYLKGTFKPMRDLAKYTSRIAKATAAGERVLDILDTTPDIRDQPGARVAPRFRGAISFEQISFAYESAHPVLEDVSFELLPGQFVALVGPSGGGKSTLASLLLRLYEPQQGRILIDGCDVREYTLESVRAQMSVVLQDAVLFAVSIRENIAYGSQQASDEEIEAAARRANAHNFIMALPEGYDTILGERGATLSGGQRQRITIARAILRGAPIVVLDEPTTGLDKENERAVQRALDELREGCTTVLITHDLSAAKAADLILYVEGGRIVERGTHVELKSHGGRYAALYALQSLSKDE